MIKPPLLIWFAQSPLCEGLSDAEIEQVYGLFEEKEYPAGAALYKEGDPADALYVMLEGRVEVSRGGRVLGENGPGASVGEMGVFRHAQQRSATVTCATAVTVLRIGRERFHQALIDRDVPAMLVANLSQQLAERLAQMNAKVAKAA